jgi:phosphatidylserine decarboxylase
VLVFPRIEVGCLRVKGAEVTVDELLGGTETERYRDGAAMVVRLAPADYHRFHFPDAGEAGPSRAIGGRLHSVHPIALAAGAPSLRNKRSVTLLATARFGTIALIEVGALCVGTIVQTYRPGRVARGDEKGYFRFGGSTIVVLAEPGRLHFDEDLERASADGVETLVRVGSRVGRAGA